MKIVFFTLVFSLILVSCGSKKLGPNQYDDRDSYLNCFVEWEYHKLDSNQMLTVILFDAKSADDASIYSNLLIGTNEVGDTVAIVDKDFSDDIKKGEKVKVAQNSWNKEEQKFIRPVFILRNISGENDLYCQIQTVYFGKIVKSIN